jgi:hypothetical protein
MEDVVGWHAGLGECLCFRKETMTAQVAREILVWVRQDDDVGLWKLDWQAGLARAGGGRDPRPLLAPSFELARSPPGARGGTIRQATLLLAAAELALRGRGSSKLAS